MLLETPRGLRPQAVLHRPPSGSHYGSPRPNPNEARTIGRHNIGLQGEKSRPAYVAPVEPENRKRSAPVQFFVKLLKIWDMDIVSACILLGYEKTSTGHVQAILSGAATLETRDEKDRIAGLFVIRRILHDVFRDIKVENQWLREPQGLLDGNSPRDLLLEGSWPNLLRVRQLCELMAGL